MLGTVELPRVCALIEMPLQAMCTVRYHVGKGIKTRARNVCAVGYSTVYLPINIY